MAVNVYPVTFDFILPPPSSTFSGNLAQVFQLIQQTLQGSLAQDAAVLGQGTVLPTSDLGPFIYTGYDPPQLYTWSTSQGKYIPSALPSNTNLNFITLAQLSAYFGGLNVAQTQMNVNWAQLIGLPAQLSNTQLMSGNTASRPLGSMTGQFYFDTDINCMLVYYLGGWHTVDGCTGDIKYVNAATLAAALALNPGWIQNTASIDRFIIGAGNLYGINATGGAASTVLNQAQLPAALTGLTLNTATQADSAGSITGISGGATNQHTGIALPTASIANPGGGQATPTLSPYIAAWCLIKS